MRDVSVQETNAMMRTSLDQSTSDLKKSQVATSFSKATLLGPPLGSSIAC